MQKSLISLAVLLLLTPSQAVEKHHHHRHNYNLVQQLGVPRAHDNELVQNADDDMEKEDSLKNYLKKIASQPEPGTVLAAAASDKEIRVPGYSERQQSAW